jgi:microcystin-dependent protein
MTEPFVGEIQIFGFNFAPIDWAIANGATLAISQNTPLFSLIGTTYGGNGTSTFQLPNLIGRQPCSQGQGLGLSDRFIGEPFGEDNVALLVSQMPNHSHTFTPSNHGGTATLTAAPKQGSGVGKFAPDIYVPGNPATNASFAPAAVGIAGNGLPHNNQQPFLAVNMCIALYGVFPSFN